jgi:hypothetical protein
MMGYIGDGNLSSFGDGFNSCSLMEYIDGEQKGCIDMVVDYTMRTLTENIDMYNGKREASKGFPRMYNAMHRVIIGRKNSAERELFEKECYSHGWNGVEGFVNKVSYLSSELEKLKIDKDIDRKNYGDLYEFLDNFRRKALMSNNEDDPRSSKFIPFEL